MIESDDDGDEPRLSAATLTALQQFLTETQDREQRSRWVSDRGGAPNATFEEDWQLSQFWYDDRTTDSIVRGAINSTPTGGKIALISCPTLYGKLKRSCSDREVKLFEYDTRFKVFGVDFISYDYKVPLGVPREMSGRFDLVVADPPFLSEECLTKMAVTIKFLSKEKIVLCTGAVMQTLAERLLNLKRCDFLPAHKNNLANEFYCYSNFNFDAMLQ